MVRRSVVVLRLGAVMGLSQACGLDVAESTAAGGSSEGGGTSVSTGVLTEDSGTADECSVSDLPEPFCHSLFIVDDPPGRIIGVHDQPRESVRPFVMHSNAFGIRLVNPLATDVVFAETAVPFEYDWHDDGDLVVWNGDFDDDGVGDLLLLTEGLRPEIAILDGQDLGTLALHSPLSPDGPVTRLRAQPFEYDGDGSDELLLAAVTDVSISLEVWDLDSGELRLLESVSLGGCPGIDLIASDYDGDGQTDAAIVWSSLCNGWQRLLDTEVILLLGGEHMIDPTSAARAPHPDMAHAAAVDVDGDGDSELVIATSVNEILVLDWASGELRTSMVGIAEFTSETFGTFRPVVFPATTSSIVVGAMQEYFPEGGFVNFYAAFAPDGSGELVRLPHRYLRIGPDGTPSPDLNADGISDLVVTTDLGLGLYLSH